MEGGIKSERMAQYTTGNGKTVKQRVLENSYTQTEMFTRETGLIISQMAMEFIKIV
jgi:hypothetical protein